MSSRNKRFIGLSSLFYCRLLMGLLSYMRNSGQRMFLCEWKVKGKMASGKSLCFQPKLKMYGCEDSIIRKINSSVSKDYCSKSATFHNSDILWISGSTKQQQQAVKFALPPGLTGYLPQRINSLRKFSFSVPSED